MTRLAWTTFAILAACSGEIEGTPQQDGSVDGTTQIDAPAGGGGTLQITFTATPTAGGGGQYSPKHVAAVWVQGPTGTTFVKTIGRWAGTRVQHLVAWRAASGTGDADAVSGATQNAYSSPLSLTWDLKNRAGTVIPDGTYTVRMESTDLNATTAAQNNQGTFTFVKGAAPQMQTGLSNGGFTNVSIKFTP